MQPICLSFKAADITLFLLFICIKMLYRHDERKYHFMIVVSHLHVDMCLILFLNHGFHLNYANYFLNRDFHLKQQLTY
jgi:hypothetical protein